MKAGNLIDIKTKIGLKLIEYSTFCSKILCVKNLYLKNRERKKLKITKEKETINCVNILDSVIPTFLEKKSLKTLEIHFLKFFTSSFYQAK